MKQKRIRQLKQGEVFRLAESDSAPVWVRGEYDRSERKFECYKYDDVNHWGYFSGSRLVFIGFDF